MSDATRARRARHDAPTRPRTAGGTGAPAGRGGSGTGHGLTAGDADAEALDAYSRIVTAVADRLLPSVASLRTMTGPVAERRERGGGSAVVLTGDGFLVTSAHVVHGSQGGVAALADGTEAEFAVVGVDRLSDLAIVRVHGSALAPADIGDADGLRVGQLVVAVGSPLGYSGSVSAGVVSAVGRSLTATDGDRARIVDDVIQTDAALHPGNSGGALAVSTGEVVGINTAVVGPMIGQGLGLAVPLNATTKQVLVTLINEGRVRRAQLGVAGGTRPLPPRAASALGNATGVEVTSVVHGSPADLAGIGPEVIIAAVDGVPVASVGDLQRLMTAERIGSRCRLTIVRGGEVTHVEVVPDELL